MRLAKVGVLILRPGSSVGDLQWFGCVKSKGKFPRYRDIPAIGPLL
jgi:hypothetical protein